MKTAGIGKQKRKEIWARIKTTSILLFEEMAPNPAEDDLASEPKQMFHFLQCSRKLNRKIRFIQQKEIQYLNYYSLENI